MRQNLKITKREEELMNIFWESDQPLSSFDLLDKIGGTTSEGYFYSMLRTLEKKGLIENCGLAKCQKTNMQYGRVFRPTICREEYYVCLALERGVDETAFAKYALAAAYAKEKKTDHRDLASLSKTLDSFVEELMEQDEGK